MHNAHVQMDSDPRLFLFDTHVNTTQILILITVDGDLDHDPVSLPHVNAV